MFAVRTRLLGWSLAMGLGWICWTIARGAEPEFRALWADAFHAGFKSPAEVAQLVSDLRAGHFNAVVVEVRKRGDAYYESFFEPKATDIDPGYDPLADLIARAHDTRAGQRIEVHAWIVVYPVWNREDRSSAPAGHVVRTHPEWLSETESGALWVSGVNNYQLDPGHPEVQQHLFNICMDLVTRYDLDGLNFDYIRYPGPDWGYNPMALERFNRQTGQSGRPPSDDPQWLQWRRDQVTALVRKVYLSTIALKPWVKLSADTICWAPGVTSEAGFISGSAAYNRVLQDWRGWMEEGILDLAIPMTYFDQSGAYVSAWFNWNQFTKDHQYGRQAALGLGLWLNSISNTLVQIQQARAPSPSGHRAVGVCGFSYASLTSDSVSRSTFWRALTDPAIAGRYQGSGPPVFADIVEPPSMPWKSSPTRGHLKGRVLVDGSSATVDGAAVTLSGPESRTIFSDATGFYGAVDLSPGIYVVEAEAGDLGHAHGQVQITAGTVTTFDLRVSDQDRTPPLVEDFRVAALADVAAALAWTTDEPATAVIAYSPAGGPVQGILTNLEPKLLHMTKLSGLAPETRYRVTLVVRDEAGNASAPINFEFTTPPAGQVGEIVMDNTDAQVEGRWSRTDNAPTKYGEDYLYSARGGGRKAVIFRPPVLVPGLYTVFEWHPAGGTRTTEAPYEITHANGVTTIPVNQQLDDGVWHALGTFAFAADSTEQIRITDAIPESNRVVIADAIKLVYLSPIPARFVAVEPLPDGSVRMSIMGTRGCTQRLLWSADLLQWELRTTWQDTGEPFDFIEPPARLGPRGFYRVETQR